MNAEEQVNSDNKKTLLPLCVAALGIVFGDIGTSPIYALRSCFTGTGLAVTDAKVLGILSLIFWSLTIVVAVKYLVFLFRVDNRGEGGILALLALLRKSRWTFVVPLGIFGAALLFGDGIITPAISVLSAVEGLNVGTNIFQEYIVGITIGVLTMLFLVQKKGSAQIGAVFGIVMIVWFLTIGILGLLAIMHAPKVLLAVNPWYAFQMLLDKPMTVMGILGAVFLAITGGEVLYADMGHFGKKPIRLNWFILVFPALTLNYFGQGAYLLQHPGHLENLFYHIAPHWLLYPLIGLATMATVIAAQAVISGIFSLARQAIQLGLWPRMTIIHTSEVTIGQIYMPEINWMLWAGAVTLVIGFKNSDSLAGAYGTAVSGTMLITSIIAVLLAPHLWKSRLLQWPVLLMFGIFLTVDLAFCSANFTKILHGGWIPLVLAAALYIGSHTWRKGRAILGGDIAKNALAMDIFLKSIKHNPPIKVPGIAVFMSANAGVPRILLHNLKHNKVLHETTILLNITTKEIPFVPDEERTIVTTIDKELGLYNITLQYGFCQNPNIPRALKDMPNPPVDLKYKTISYFLGRESLVLSERRKQLFRWQKILFVFLARNAYDVTRYFAIPPNQVTEFGMQMEL